MLATGSDRIDAERAFARAVRTRRRRAATDLLLRGVRPRCRRLPVRDERDSRPRGGRGVREIPLDAITGTLEPSRSLQFDCAFGPAPVARERWQGVWLAEHRGTPLPPIAVTPVEGGYALRDGHHRVSVARARRALTIEATLG